MLRPRLLPPEKSTLLLPTSTATPVTSESPCPPPLTPRCWSLWSEAGRPLTKRARNHRQI